MSGFFKECYSPFLHSEKLTWRINLSKNFTKEELKQPDQLQAELRKGFVWTTSHSKAVIAAIAIFAVVGGGIAFSNHYATKKELAAQENYYSIEKSYLEKKRAFDEASAKKETAKMSSGDLAKDYSDIPAKFEAYIQQAPKSHGAQMAALNLADIYSQYNQLDKALSTLESVSAGLNNSDTISALVYLKLGGVLADQKNCEKAISYWEKITNQSAFAFAHDEAKLRMGICYESLNQNDKAEKLFTEVSTKQDETADFGAARDAEKYLNMIKAKKNLFGSGT